MKAHELIADAAHFTQGTCARNRNGVDCGTAHDSGAVQFDCLGALLFAYPDSSVRHAEGPNGEPSISKRVFGLCRARYDHTYPGRLEHEQTVDLLRSAGV